MILLYVVVRADRITDYIRHMLRNSSAMPCSGGDTIWVIRLICFLRRFPVFGVILE